MVRQPRAGLFEGSLNPFDENCPHLAAALESLHRGRRHAGRAGRSSCSIQEPPRKPALYRDNRNHDTTACATRGASEQKGLAGHRRSLAPMPLFLLSTTPEKSGRDDWRKMVRFPQE